MLSHEWLRNDIRTRLFGAAQEPGVCTLGLEVEFIPQRASDHSVLPLFGAGGTVQLLRVIAGRHGWQERLNDYGVPIFRTPNGGTLSFEPGGQIEYSSRTHANASALLHEVRALGSTLIDECCAAGVSLVSAGIDPFNGPEQAPLQLTTARYRNMARHFAAIGPAGARMMRQTTAVQVNIGAGTNPLRRWRLLNSLTAPLTALFANSPLYAGQNTGSASYRSQTWRETDPARTGVVTGPDPAQAYLDFALQAAAILPPLAGDTFPQFATRLVQASPEDWRAHLTTLFPDVRPKGYFEIRCIDGQPVERYGAVVALVVGLTLDPVASTDAEVILPPPSNERIARAGEKGLADYELRSVCEDLIETALAGCRRLPGVLAGGDVAEAEDVLRGLLDRARPGSSSGVAGYGARERLPR
jgi:glutamate--cysteine ligase